MKSLSISCMLDVIVRMEFDHCSRCQQYFFDVNECQGVNKCGRSSWVSSSYPLSFLFYANWRQEKKSQRIVSEAVCLRPETCRMTHITAEASPPSGIGSAARGGKDGSMASDDSKTKGTPTASSSSLISRAPHTAAMPAVEEVVLMLPNVVTLDTLGKLLAGAKYPKVFDLGSRTLGGPLAPDSKGRRQRLQ